MPAIPLDMESIVPTIPLEMEFRAPAIPLESHWKAGVKGTNYPIGGGVQDSKIPTIPKL